MSELKMKTIESLPLIEEPSENATIMGLKEGRAVQIPVGAVGGGTTGVVFTYEWDENADSGSIASLEVEESGAYVTSCSHSFEECYELILAGSPVVFIDKDNQGYSKIMSLSYGTSGDEHSVLGGDATSEKYINIKFMTPSSFFTIEYTADYLDGYYPTIG